MREVPEDLLPFEGMAPLDWMRANWARFDFSADAIKALAEPYPCALDYRISGIYFLIECDEIAYVGLSNHVGRRLIEHCKQKSFARVFAFEAPNLILPHIEAHYIDTLSPPLNMTRFHQREQLATSNNNRKRIVK